MATFSPTDTIGHRLTLPDSGGRPPESSADIVLSADVDQNFGGHGRTLRVPGRLSAKLIARIDVRSYRIACEYRNFCYQIPD